MAYSTCQVQGLIKEGRNYADVLGYTTSIFESALIVWSFALVKMDLEAAV
jgi:hypothetical protein